MKNIILLLFLFGLGTSTTAQTAQKNKTLSIGYFSNYFIQPGLEINGRFDFKTWQKENSTKINNLFVRPQIAYFARPEIHQSFLLSTDFGYRRTKTTSKKYIAWSIGLGYLTQSQVTELRVNLSDGSKEKTRENWGYFVPTINYEFGKAINDKISWYSKYSLGLKMASEQERSLVIYIGLGLSYNL